MSDSFQQEVFALIQSLTGQENILAIPKEFIRYTGDLSTGVFLSQLIYWCDKGSRNDGFIYKPRKEWQEELGMTDYAVRKARKKLEDMGIIETELRRADGSPTIHYRLKKDVFIKSFCQFQKGKK